MTTTLADLLAGVDMEGGEGFCDSVYNFLKNQGKDINLLTNSGFGVWSQSDANKGLATLVYDTLAGGVFAVGDTITGAVSGAVGKVMTDNGATSMTLGAVSGTFQDPEQIGNGVGVTAQVNGDTDIGVKNDPCNNNSTAIWTRDAGLNLAFGAALYTVDTNAVNLRAWITAGATLVAGKIYKIELDINDGVVNTKGVQGYFDDGAAQYGRTRTTGAGFASFSWTFECATSTAAGKIGFRIVENLGGAGQNIQIRRFSCYEIAPCCTGGDALAFDGWSKAVGMDLYRQHNDSGTLTKDGSFYSVKLAPGTVAHTLYYPLSGVETNAEWYQQFAGRTVTFGVWVKTSTASHLRASLWDGVSETFTSYHTGGGGWEWLEVTKVNSAATTSFQMFFYCNAAPAVNGDTIAYISQPMLVFGWSLGEGMYQPRLQEVISLEKEIRSNLLDNSPNLSDVAITLLNIEADSDAKLPKGIKALFLRSHINDSGSAGNNFIGLFLRKDAIASWQYINDISGLTGDLFHHVAGKQGCNVDGDIEYKVDASGGSTLNINEFRYNGVQVN